MKTLDRPGRRGRPKKENAMEVLAVRLPPETISEVDQYADQIQEQYPGLAVSRADAVRQLILLGLQHKK